MKLGKSFINDIRELIRSARATVARGVDLVQVHTNFEIGRRIFEQEQKGQNRAAYGRQVVKALAEQLTAEFGSGFSKRNLDYFRRFYLEYARRQVKIVQTMSAQLASDENRRTSPDPSHVFQTLSGELQAARSVRTAHGQLAHPSLCLARPFTLSWSHYVFLLGVKNPDERSFYEIEATRQGWTLRELKRQFDSSLYERLALSRDKKGIRQLAKKGQVVNRPQDLLKEPFVLEFLGLDEKHRYSESDLESAIISQIERFLLELGKGFLFEARQKRFTFDEEHFFVDLVFYNRLLRCYVLIDLKIGKLTHQDLGQMQMYVNYFDREVKRAGEKSTVGIVLCKQKNKALVEITLPKGAHIHAKEYQLYLPSKAELRRKLDEWAREAENE